MKIYSTLASCFALLLLVSCSNDEITTTPETKTYTPVATAGFGEFVDVSKPKASTRAGVIEENPDYETKGEIFYWANGDKAKVLFFKDGDLETEPIERIYVATVTDSEKPKRCDFTLQGSEGLKAGNYTVYALYPADGWSKDAEGYKATMPDFTSEAYQQKADGSSTHVGAGMFMKAKSTVEIGEGKENSFDMGFKHLVAMVRVRVENEIAASQAYMDVYLATDRTENNNWYHDHFIIEAYLEGGITGSSLVPAPSPTYVKNLHVHSAQSLAKNEGYPGPHNYIYIPVMPTAVGLYSISAIAMGPNSPNNHNRESVYASDEPWVGEGIKAGYSYYFDVVFRK